MSVIDDYRKIMEEYMSEICTDCGYEMDETVDFCQYCLKVKDSDPIKKPSHYMHGGLETKQIIKALLTPEEYRGYCKGNIIKYMDRAPYKGQTEQDYGKRKEYFDWLTEVEG